MARAAAPAWAHGFGQRYELPLPLSFYLFGAAATVVFSFVVVGLFVTSIPRERRYPTIIFSGVIGRLIQNRALAWAIRSLAAGLFVITLAAGIWGNQDPYRNIAPTLVWIICWVGLAYVSAFLGNLWPLINPWWTIFSAAERVWHRMTGSDLSLRRPYPKRLGVWPAVILLFAFSWFELVYPSPAVPSHIACFLVIYSILTWTGLAVFGKTWLTQGEVFTAVFGLFARFAPTEASASGPTLTLALRPPGAGLLEGEAASRSMTALVLVLLSSVLYDGALATPQWNDFETWISPLVGGEYVAAVAIRTVGLLAFWLVFFGAYTLTSVMMSAAVLKQLSPGQVAMHFAFTLVPIAIGYHLAHYLTYLLIQGQYIIPLLSDPFGFGWNLFGTADYREDIGFVGARFGWYAAVVAIVLGHVIAVCLAHLRAMGGLGTRRTAFMSQIPLTALMVIYTFVSLSILAEPVTEHSAVEPEATEIVIPSSAMLPRPGDGHLQPASRGKIARQKLTYRLLSSAFHDGSRMTSADLLYAYMFAYRWGVANGTDKSHYDRSIDLASTTLRAHLAAVRILGTDTTSKTIRFGDLDYVRALFIVEVFTDLSPVNAEQDAAVAPPWTTLPWHVVVLMEEAVTRGWATFSQEEAQRRGIPWLDLVRSDEMNGRLAAIVDSFARDGYRPEILKPLVSAMEARERWQALAAFYRTHHHFLVTNGPYQLKSWSGDAVQLEVFRDLSYPLGVGSYDSYAIPRHAFITKVKHEKNQLRIFGEVETVVKFQRDYRIERVPLQELPVEAANKAAPECRFVIVDDRGRVVLAGRGELGDDRTFQIDLSGKLSAGSYFVFAEIIVNGNAMNAKIERIPVTISSSS